MSEDRDQLDAPEELDSTAAEGVAPEAEQPEGDAQPQLDEDGNPIEPEPPEDDSEEVDYEGQKYKLPKALKDALLRQADYTRKTQEIADTRKALEARQAEIAQQAEAREATLEQRVQLAQADAALAQYEAMDWNEYAETYGDRAAIQAQGQWQQLRGAREKLASDISAKETEARSAGEQATANAIREAEQVLAQEIPGFGPEVAAKAWQAASSIGLTQAEFRSSFVGDDGKADVRTFKALAELAELRAYKAANEAKNTKAQTVQKVAAVKPAETVNAKSNGYKPGLNDDLPVEEWVRRRNAQLAKAGG